MNQAIICLVEEVSKEIVTTHIQKITTIQAVVLYTQCTQCKLFGRGILSFHLKKLIQRVPMDGGKFEYNELANILDGCL